jgi:hypothetical protein
MTRVLSRVTLDNPLAPLGERVASPFALPLRTALSAAKGLRVNSASRVRGSVETSIVRNYAGHHTSVASPFAEGKPSTASATE